MPEKIVLIDGHSMLNRAFYGLPDMTNSQGIHTNAVYGFLNILFRILEDEQPQYLAVAFDVHAPTFRHQMYDAYKGTRKPMPEELRPQVPLMQELLTAMNIPCLSQAGLEADDILGTMARRAQKDGLEAVIVSGDRDLLQLADQHIKIRIPKTSKGKTEIFDYYADDVKTAYGVTPSEFIDVKALMGDASDNIPGVPSIGEKTATKIIQAYGSIENAYAHIAQIKPPRASAALSEHYDMAVMSKALATICTDCDINCDRETTRIRNFYTPEAYALIKQLGFKSMLSRFEADAPAEEQKLTWRVISTPEEAAAIFRHAAGSPCLGMELATLPEEWKARLLAAAITTAEGTCYIPVNDAIDAKWLGSALAALAASASCVWTTELKAALAVLMPAFAAAGFPPAGPNARAYGKGELPDHLYDLHLAAYLLNPLNSDYTYDEIAAAYLGRTLPGLADIAGKKPLDALTDEQLQSYVCSASYTAFAAGPVLLQKLKEADMLSLYQEIDLPLIYSLYTMEQNGIRVQRDELVQYGESLTDGINTLEKEIYEMTGETFNILSPKQLGEVLFDKLHYPYAKKTKTGYSTSADVLEKLADSYPVVRKILDYRQVTKLKSTYAVGLEPFICSDGRIHGKFHQTITATGRLSSADPNLQNIPVRMELGRAIRKVFVPRQNWIFVDADYSQIELRILAHMSGDESLIEAYRQAQDIHAITASQVFHVPLDEVTPQLRRNAKAVNFGIVYGISAFGLSEDLSISRKEATEYIERYFATYPKVKQFLDGLVASAKQSGYSLTMFGRRRPVPELKSSNYMQRSFGERVAMNAPIQGSAADIIKIAMTRVDNRLRADGLQARLVLQVHDELLIEAPPEEEAAVRAILSEEMFGAAELSVPLEIGLSSGRSWFETK